MNGLDGLPLSADLVHNRMTISHSLLIGMDVLGTLEKVSIDYRRKEVGLLPHDRGAPSVVQKYFSFDTW